MKNTFESAMEYINLLNDIYPDWNKDKKTIASAMVSYAAKISYEKERELLKSK